jgi:hypothetical protein
MVHALKEAWRVLVLHGIMIDVRPLCVDVPLEIVFEGGCESAGIIDLSPDIGRDIAADRAVDLVLQECVYNAVNVEFFDFAYYWTTFKDMEEDLEENWKDEVVIPEEVWARAHTLFKKRRPQTRIRVGVRMKLGKYEKQEKY